MANETLGISQAFASIAVEKNQTFGSTGLTKREYFAGLAMQGLLSNSSIVDIHSGLEITWVAEHATRQADELLKQLEK